MKKVLFLLFLFTAFTNFSFCQWTTNGTNIYNSNSGNVGIGSSINLSEKLTVNGNIQLNDYDDTYISRYIRFFSRFTLQSFANPNNNWTPAIVGQNIIWDNINNVWKIDGDAYSDFAAMRFENGGGIGFYSRPTTGSSYTLSHSQMDAYRRFYINADGGVKIDASSSANANAIIQGGAGTYPAWWLTGANGVFKIGGNGATEPSLGAINIDYTGKVGIGTTSMGSFQLAVEGKIGAREVHVTLQNP